MGRMIIRSPLLTLPTKSAYFVTSAGFYSLALAAPLAAYATHFESQIRRSILLYEGINLPKSQIWQSSQGFTMDDYGIIGGIGGMLLSFRMRSLRSLSIGHRLLGRLGAFSTGLLVSDIPLWVLGTDLQERSAQRSHYVKAVALRKLNNDPNFNQSLPPRSQLPERIWKMTARAERDAMSFDSLTDEEKALLQPTMVFSWLDTLTYSNINKTPGDALPMGWKYPEGASAAQKREYTLKGIQFVANMLKPYAHNNSFALQGRPIPRHETFSVEYATLTRTLVTLMHGMLIPEEGKPEPRMYIHDCLSVIDADKGEDHVPVETLDCLRVLKTAFEKRNQPEYVAGINNLIRECKGRAAKNKEARSGRNTIEG